MEVKYRTEDMSARSGKDYEGGEGTVIFEHGEMTKTLEITIYDDKVNKCLNCNPFILNLFVQNIHVF